MQHRVKLPLFTVHTQRSPYIFHRGIHSVHVVIWRRAKPCARNLNSTKCTELKQIHKSCQGEWGCVRLERTWERFRRQRHYLCADRQVVLVTSTTCYTAVRYHQFTPTSTSTQISTPEQITKTTKLHQHQHQHQETQQLSSPT